MILNMNLVNYCLGESMPVKKRKKIATKRKK